MKLTGGILIVLGAITHFMVKAKQDFLLTSWMRPYEDEGALGMMGLGALLIVLGILLKKKKFS